VFSAAHPFATFLPRPHTLAILNEANQRLRPAAFFFVPRVFVFPAFAGVYATQSSSTSIPGA
jgi:hypothetical protein